MEKNNFQIEIAAIRNGFILLFYNINRNQKFLTPKFSIN